ncbi:hypothetical protein COOONC_19595 [Cooperia oncophora]
MVCVLTQSLVDICPDLRGELVDYMNTAPSSSTHSAPDTDSSGKKGKRYRTMDSDSEVDRDKRRRRNEESKLQAPAALTRNPSSNSDSIRALFGSGVERKEPPDKGISPDSGVHSAENDPGDENDVHSAQNIINLITKLSPPLSPIKQRPFDKKAERERKEMEIKEKERLEQQRKEKEERERQEREQAEREERLRNERLEHASVNESMRRSFARTRKKKSFDEKRNGNVERRRKGKETDPLLRNDPRIRIEGTK